MLNLSCCFDYGSISYLKGSVTRVDFPKSIILTWEEFLTSIFPECRSLCNNPLTCNSWIAMHISMAIFMAVRNGTVQFAKNFFNVGQHDAFASDKSSIKIYRGEMKPKINRNFHVLPLP